MVSLTAVRALWSSPALREVQGRAVAREKVLALPVVAAVVAGLVRHLSEVVAGCSGAEDFRAATGPILMAVVVVRLVVVPPRPARFGGQAVAQAIGMPTPWNGWLPCRRVWLTSGLSGPPVTPIPN